MPRPRRQAFHTGTPGSDEVALRRVAAEAFGPEVSMVPRSVSGTWLFDLAVNGRVVQEHPNAAASAKVDSDVALLIENVPSGTRTTFEAVRFASYTQSPNGDISTATTTLAATGSSVDVRVEFRRMSTRVIRKRIFLKATVATAVRITDGILGSTTNMTTVSWDETNPNGSGTGGQFQPAPLAGLSHSLNGVGYAAYGMGVTDGFRAGRQVGQGTTSNVWSAHPTLLGGIRAFVGNSSGLPALAVGTTESYVDLFYWAADWQSPATRHRALAEVYADALGLPRDADPLMRLIVASAASCKGTTSPGAATPSLSYYAGFGRMFVRDGFWTQTALNDHAFSAACLARIAANLGTGTGAQLNNVPDFLNDDGSGSWRSSADNNALALIWAYWLNARQIPSGNSAATNGLTDTQRNNIASFMTGKDDGTGQQVFSRATDGAVFGHYDWYTVPASIGHYASPHTTGYYAAALTAAKRLGYTPGGIDTTIANATTRYQEFYDATLGHLRFLKNTDAGTFLTYGSLLDLLPEWHAVFVLGVELLGQSIVAATIEYFMDTHMVAFDQGGRALRVIMQHGGASYLPSAEISSIAPGTYVNGGSQLPFDFMVASLGQYYGVAGMRAFWQDRKRAETNLEFDVHEALTTVNPSPDPTTNPYNGRTVSRNMGWHGVVAAYEKYSGLVD